MAAATGGWRTVRNVASEHHVRASRLAVLSLVGLLLVLAACQPSPAPVPSAAGGTYTSKPYHFSVRYPTGWQAVESQQSSSIVPLTLVITRVHASTAEGGAVSTFTVTVFDAHDTNIALSVKGLAHDKTLTRITLAGLPAYQGTPIQQPAPGTQLNDIHTDYYLPTTTYEYQLSTDAIAGDGADAALRSMLTSFTLLK